MTRSNRSTPGLARLRAAPGAEVVRRQVVAEQDAAMAAERAAPHRSVTSVKPISKGSRVRDMRRGESGRWPEGVVLHTHVHVGSFYGHVVHWGGDDVELVSPDALTVI